VNYTYRAKVDRIIDGDTVDVDIDLGCHVVIRERLRLYGINAPELRKPTRQEGIAATEWLTQALNATDDDGYITIKTHKDKKGKYGRYLATLFDANGVDLNSHMVAAGHAVFVDY